MKAVKYVLIALGTLIILFLAFAYMQDREVTVTRSIVVNAPVSVVFNQVNNLENRLKWSPWRKEDTTMKATLGETTIGEGANYSWTSENSGAGRLEYVKVIPNEKIVTDLYFTEDDNPAKGIFEFEAVEDGTKVKWTFEGDMGNNPIHRLMGRFMETILGPMFDTGLKGLKEAREASKTRPKEPVQTITVLGEPRMHDGVDIFVVETLPFAYISKKDSCSLSEMGERIGANYAALGQYAGENGLEMAGVPIVYYHLYEPPEKIVFEPAFRLTSKATGSDIIHAGFLPATHAIMAIHHGSYENSAVEWNALESYIKEYEMVVAGSPWEEYITDPGSEPDTAKWVTRIFFPVE